MQVGVGSGIKKEISRPPQSTTEPHTKRRGQSKEKRKQLRTAARKMPTFRKQCDRHPEEGDPTRGKWGTKV